MIRRPPRSPLFPYPPLFRSGRAGLINSGGASGANDFEEAVATAVINKRAGGTGLISGRKAFQRPMKEGDRKSTRLNSSHSQISYAVFCLKKKKNYATQSTPT